MLPLLSSPSAVTAGPGAKGGGFGPQARILPASFQPEACELLSSKYNHLFLADGVIGAAAQARAVFDERFAQPRNAQPERFVWDFWHVTHRPEDLPCPRSSPSPESSSSGKPTEFDSLAEATSAAANSECSGYGSISPAAAASAAAASGQQYTMLRTAASDYFNSSLFEELCTQITEYGREQLGCDAITPPWLALYTDGCSQNFHSDAPHGPFAFVLSLTPEGAYAPQDGSVSRDGFHPAVCPVLSVQSSLSPVPALQVPLPADVFAHVYRRRAGSRGERPPFFGQRFATTGEGTTRPEGSSSTPSSKQSRPFGIVLPSSIRGYLTLSPLCGERATPVVAGSSSLAGSPSRNQLSEVA